ncbi:MAG: hypothetical protein QNK24_06105 [Desulfuromusa sp.]|nr:hypothetical protein [Desulfuromusa sp.]
MNKNLFDQRFFAHSPLLLSWSALLLIIVYATWNTGLVSDDFALLNRGLSISIWDDLIPSVFVTTPFLHYALSIFYHAIGDAFWGYSVLKAFYLCFASYAVFLFFSKFTSENRAFLGMLVFVFSPIHDGVTLWLVGHYLMMSLACYLFAFVLASDGRYKTAIFFALAASFTCYGSAPVALFLGCIFLWRREFLNACVILIPNMIYTLYYIGTSVFLKVGTERIPTAWDWLQFSKSYVMQLLSYVDAAIGPSAILKTILAISSLEVVSIVIVCGFAILIWPGKRSEGDDVRPSASILFFALCMLLGAFALFASTGRYPQISFNLGDRVTIFGSFFLALLAMRWMSKRLLACTAMIICAAFVGLGDHWSSWNETTLTTISNIRNNEQLNSLEHEDRVFVKGLQYSQLGPMAHIDHFSSGYVIQDVFIYAMQSDNPPETVSLNRSMDFVDGELIDRKFGARYPISGYINVYDAASDHFERIDAVRIRVLLDSLPVENRHWVQLLGPGIIRDTVVWLMPGISYAFTSS